MSRKKKIASQWCKEVQNRRCPSYDKKSTFHSSVGDVPWHYTPRLYPTVEVYRQVIQEMVVIKEVQTGDHSPIKAQELTPESFAPFGSVISADHQISNAPKSSANQGTAVKLHKVAPVTNGYASAPSGTAATANWNIFRCSPPKHLISNIDEDVKEYQGSEKFKYLSKVLERHPFSTQTFSPLGRDAKSTGYLVIVAPNDPNNDNLPDYTKAEAFVCKGNQSVTYGMGTWHAPMIALGEEDHLDFAVLVHENGVPEEDCEEVTYSPGIVIYF